MTRRNLWLAAVFLRHGTHCKQRQLASGAPHRHHHLHGHARPRLPGLDDRDAV